MPVLDGIRGLAILMVLIFHFIGDTSPISTIGRAIVKMASYGSYGVELFFVLSGFLITGILYDARKKPHFFRNFYMRRVLRIFPLYYGVLFVIFVIAPLVPLLQGNALDYLTERQAWAWLYAVNLYIAKQGAWSFSYLQHFWSLAVEEHFYLFWPYVVFVLAHRPRTLVAVCLTIALGAMLARLAGSLYGLNWWTIYVLTPFRLDGLALGAFLAMTMRQPGGLERLVHALPRVLLVAGSLLALTFFWTLVVSQQRFEPLLQVRAALILILLACLLVWALIAPERSATSRFFHSRTMAFLGTYSYGLYVYHHLISYYLATHRTEFALARALGSHDAAIAVQATLGIGVSVALAYLSYEFYEKRFLRMKRFYLTSEKPAQPPSGKRVSEGP
jgi:peptidoglycan/LPS O-acetylase OafA/YrhL